MRQPIREAGLEYVGGIGINGEESALVGHRRPVIGGTGIGDDVARVIAESQTSADEFVEAELFWSGDFHPRF